MVVAGVRIVQVVSESEVEEALMITRIDHSRRSIRSAASLSVCLLPAGLSCRYHRLPLCAPLPRPLDGKAADFLGAVVVEPPAVCHLRRGGGGKEGRK